MEHYDSIREAGDEGQVVEGEGDGFAALDERTQDVEDLELVRGVREVRLNVQA